MSPVIEVMYLDHMVQTSVKQVQMQVRDSLVTARAARRDTGTQTLEAKSFRDQATAIEAVCDLSL